MRLRAEGSLFDVCKLMKSSRNAEIGRQQYEIKGLERLRWYCQVCQKQYVTTRTL